MSLIHNETRKLVAAALDRASTACLTVGILAPAAAALYTSTGVPLAALVGGWVVWLVPVLALHWRARLTLEGLRP